MRVLVTGGAGPIGRVVRPPMPERGDEAPRRREPGT